MGGGGARARFIISRLIAPVQEKSGSLGNRMPFSFNCQPPRTVNPPPPSSASAGPSRAHAGTPAEAGSCVILYTHHRTASDERSLHTAPPNGARGGWQKGSSSSPQHICLFAGCVYRSYKSPQFDPFLHVVGHVIRQKKKYCDEFYLLVLVFVFSNAKENSVISFALQKTTTSKGPRFAHLNLILFVF